MFRSSRTLLFILWGVAFCALVACGDFATRNVCLQNADPSCVPAASDPETPNLVGPNPNYPVPGAFTNPANAGRASGPGATPVLLNELLLDPIGVNAGAQKVELWNSGSTDVDLSGFALDFGTGRHVLQPGTVILAGSCLVVHLGVVGIDDQSNAYAPGVPEVDALSGECAFVSDTGVIADYVQWGAAGHSLEAYAANEGQWTTGLFCVKPVESTSLAFIGWGNSPLDFTARYPTLGAPN